jgi:signal peptidase I
MLREIGTLPAPGVATPEAAREQAPTPESAAAASAPRVKSTWREWAETLLTTFIIFLLVELFVVQGFKVYGSCMEPNLVTGERLLGNKLIYHLQPVHRGDIVVFRPPHKADTPFIKRVIGLPGEVIAIRRNQVYINGTPLDEPYLRYAWHDDRPAERIRPGMVYVMGDNRDNSSDSRSWGELPLSCVEAKAWVCYWPLPRARALK